MTIEPRSRLVPAKCLADLSSANAKAQMRSSYDRIADEYTRRICDELKDKPFDRAFLDKLAERLLTRGPVCDLGCGPGHVARYLADRGLQMLGVDLSTAMLQNARRLNPDIPFIQGNMLSLPVRDSAWAGIVAFYSIIHIPRALVPKALSEMYRSLARGGLLAIAFHVGDQDVHLDEWWGQPVSVDGFYYRTPQLITAAEAAGFVVEEATERDPYPGVEYPSQRGYIVARRPQSDQHA